MLLLLSSLLHVWLDFHEKLLILLILSLNINLLIICSHYCAKIGDGSWLYRFFLKDWLAVLVKRLALIFRGRFHEWIVIGWVLTTKQCRLLHIWLSWCLMSVKARVDSCIHDEKFRFQRPKFDLFWLWSYWRGSILFIFSQLTAQCSVNLLKIHSHRTWRSGSRIVTLILLH